MFAALGGVSTLVGLAAWAVRGRSSNFFAPSVYRGPRQRRSLALTFDDGPSESTGVILELLARHGVPATFFHCGANVWRLPAAARETASAGHEIGNHTYSHPALYLKTAAFIQQELSQAQDAIAAVTGTAPTLFRAPFGARWFGLREAQASLQLTGVMWTVLGLDWKLPAELIARRILRCVSPGAIICLHDGRGTASRPDVSQTIQALRQALPALAGRGYQFQTASQLLCPNN